MRCLFCLVFMFTFVAGFADIVLIVFAYWLSVAPCFVLVGLWLRDLDCCFLRWVVRVMIGVFCADLLFIYLLGLCL